MQSPELALSPSKLPLVARAANPSSDTSTVPPPQPPQPPQPAAKTKSKRRYMPKYKSSVWLSGSGTGEDGECTPTKKRKGKGKGKGVKRSNPPKQRKSQSQAGAAGLERNEDDTPKSQEEAEFLEDMDNPIGLALITHSGYKSGFRRWRKFCNNNKETYSGVDGQDLFLVNSEEISIAFLMERYFNKTSKKHVKLGADYKTPVNIDYDADGGPLPVEPDTLFKLLDAAEFDKNDCKVVEVPLGKGSFSKGARTGGWYTTKKPSKGITRPKSGKNLQSSHIRSAYCAIRDSYTLTTFNDIVSYFWEKKGESDCFASVITKPRHPGLRQLVSLTFKLNKGKPNLENENCAFAFYLFQIWQNSDHPSLRGLVVEDVPLEFSKDEQDLFKMLLCPNDPTESITLQATYNAVKKLYERFHVKSSKKTHSGRHAGTVKSILLEIPNEISRQGYYLPRSAINPSHALQKLVFPWIEDVHGDNNKEWEEECKAEMGEVDGNIVPPISDGTSSNLTKALGDKSESSKSAMMMA
ncbi:hypothetical protein BGW39_001680 [Mortierella sp. 14UC]|nr:hypothetical protein BGW39_001680 [Mortierella sp. 14UC]